MNRRALWYISALSVISGILLLVVYHQKVLNKTSHFLVASDPLEKVDAIVVLAGNTKGERMKAAVGLLHKGYGEYLVFSGARLYPGFYLNKEMERYAIEIGVKPEQIISVELHENSAVSTWGEARRNLETLMMYGFSSFIIVTSEYHSRRAHMIYKKLIEKKGYPLNFMVYPAIDSTYPIDMWWKSGEIRYFVFLEFLKLGYYFLVY